MVPARPACAIHAPSPTTLLPALRLLSAIPHALLLHILTSPTLPIVLMLLLGTKLLRASRWRQRQLLLLLAAAGADALCAAVVLHPVRHGLLCALCPLLVKVMCSRGINTCSNSVTAQHSRQERMQCARDVPAAATLTPGNSHQIVILVYNNILEYNNILHRKLHFTFHTVVQDEKR
jgi:hypothetical protein